MASLYQYQKRRYAYMSKRKEIDHLMELADESHEVARTLLEAHPRFSAAQTYYTIFYLAQAMLLTKDLSFSSHSAVIAAY